MFDWSNHYTTRPVSTGNLKAALSGVLIGCILALLMGIPLYILAPLCAVLSVFLNCWVADLHSPDEEKGAVEYSALESELDPLIANVISGTPEAMDGLILAGPLVYEALMKRAQGYIQCHGKFVVYMAAATAASWNGQDRKAIEAIDFALTVEPADLVAHFRKAEAFEYLGRDREAIRAYEEILQSVPIASKALKAFIAAQTLRVRVHGTKNRPAGSGMTYIIS